MMVIKAQMLRSVSGENKGENHEKRAKENIKVARNALADSAASGSLHIGRSIGHRKI